MENDISDDRTEDLLKIATVLTVGRRVEQEGYCPPEVEQVYNAVYRPLAGEGSR